MARIDIIGFDPGPITGSTGYAVLRRSDDPRDSRDWRRVLGGSGVIQATVHNIRVLERELRALLNLESLSKKLLTPTCIAIEAPHPGKGQSFLAVSETVGLLRSFFPEVEHVVLTAAEVRAAVCGSRKAQKADVRFTIEHTVAGWLSGRTAHECDAAAVARAVGDQLYQRYLAKEPGAIARVEARSDEQSRGTIGA